MVLQHGQTRVSSWVSGFEVGPRWPGPGFKLGGFKLASAGMLGGSGFQVGLIRACWPGFRVGLDRGMLAGCGPWETQTA